MVHKPSFELHGGARVRVQRLPLTARALCGTLVSRWGFPQHIFLTFEVNAMQTAHTARLLLGAAAPTTA